MNTLRLARAPHVLALLLTIVGLPSAASAGVPPDPQFDIYPIEPPCRLFDSRVPNGPPQLDRGTTYDVPVGGICGVPKYADGVTIDVEVHKAANPGALVVFPQGGTAPSGSPPIDGHSFQPSSNDSKPFVVKIGGSVPCVINSLPTSCTGISFFVDLPGQGKYDAIIDVTGYFTNAEAYPDTATVLEDAAATAIPVLANDNDPDDPLAIASATDPANGTVTLTGGTPGSHTGLEYQPDANYCNQPGPPNMEDTFTYTLDAGSFAEVKVTVTCVNDEPAGTDGTIGMGENTERAFTVADFGFTDPNDSPANSLLAVVITTLPGAGTIELSNVPVIAGQSIAVTDITAGNLTFTPAVGGNGTPYTSFTFQVQDNGGTANGGVDLDATPNTLTINVNSVNDAPAGTDNTITLNEDGSHTFSAPDFGFTDPNDTPANAFQAVTITTLPGAGALTLSGNPVTAGQSIPVGSIGNLVFTPVANASGSPYASFTFQVQDDGGTAGGGIDLDPTPNTITLNVTPVNDEPAGTNNTITTPEDTPYTFSAADFGFTDPIDSPANALQSVVIATLPAAGSLTLSGNPVSAGQEIPAASLGNLVFTPAANASASPYASFNFQVRDDGGTANGGVNLDATPNTMTINVTANNDAPAGTDNTVTTLEETPYTFTAADFGFTDPNDTPANALASVVITTLPGAGSLTLSGNPVIAGQDIPAASLGNLVFTPAVNGFGSPYTSFTFQVRDDGGTANSGIDLDPTPNTMTVNVTPVNDAPEGTNNTVTTLEETPYTFTAANFGFTDPNDSPANALASVVITTLPGAGSLTLSGNPVSAGQEIPVASIGNLVFTPATNGSGSPYASFTFQVRDNGGTANSGVDLDPTPNTMSIDVTPVNDAPAGTDNTVTTPEDVEYIFSAADFGFTDPNDSPANALASVVISTLPGAGSLTLSGSGFAAGTEISLANITAGNLRFQGALNAFGSPYTTFTFRVRDNGGTANSGIDLDPSANTMTINVTPVPDAPVAVDEGTPASPYVETVGNTILEVDALSDLPGAKVYFNGNILSNDFDPDGPTTFTVTLESATAGAVVSFHPSDGTFSYVPPPGFTGVDSFTYRITGPDTLFDTATVYVNVEHRVWYVRNNTATAGTAGTSEDPFDVLFEAESASGPNDTIYVFEGDGTTADQSDGITLKNGQRLIGEAVQLAVPTAVNINGTAGLTLRTTTGNRPKIENDATPDAAGEDNGVSVLATGGNMTGVEIRGLDIAGLNNAIDVTATGAHSAGVTISDNTISNDPTNGLEGVDVNAGSTGTVTLAFQENTLTARGTAFDFQRTAGTAVISAFHDNVVTAASAGAGLVVVGTGGVVTFDASPTAGIQPVPGGTTVIGTPGDRIGGGVLGGLVLTNVTGVLNFANAPVPLTGISQGDLDIFTDNGTALNIAGGVGGFDFDITSNAGVLVANAGPAAVISSADVSLQLNLLTSSTSSSGVSLTNVSGTFSVPSGVGNSITKSSGGGTAFSIDNSAAGTTVLTSTYNGTINNSSSTGRSVSINNADSGSAVSFTGKVTDSPGQGVTLTANTGATISFSGGLTLSTGANTGFNATGGGTVTVTDPVGLDNNTITTAGGTALNVNGTTIGIGDMTFESISAGTSGSPANGIVLNNTGTSGELIVTGTGTAGSGGTIQNTTGHAITLNATKTPSFSFVNVTNTGGDGINANSMTSGLTLTSCQITNTGNGDNENGMTLFNVGGTVSVQGTTFSNAAEELIEIDSNNNSNMILNVGTISASTFSFPNTLAAIRAGGAFAGNGILITSRGTSNYTVNINNSTFTDIKGFGFQFGGDGTTAGTNCNINLDNNDLLVTVVNSLGNSNNRSNTINIQGRNTVDIDASITNNLLDGGGGGGIQLGADQSSNINANITNNIVSDQFADGILIGVDENASMTLLIDSNQISNTSSDGMEIANAISPGGTSTLNATITNNIVTNHNTNVGANAFFAGIGVFGGVEAADATFVDVNGNSVSGNPNPGTYFDYALDGSSFGDAITLEGPGSAAVAEADFLAAPPPQNTSAAPAGGRTFIGNAFYSNGATVPLPVLTP